MVARFGKRRTTFLVHFRPSYWSGLPYLLDPASARPLYRQLSDQIIRRVRGGELRPGHRLPGARRLAADLGLNRNTVVAAYGEAVDQGYLEGRGGSGTYVARRLPEPEGPPSATPRVAARAAFAFAGSATSPPPSAPAGKLRLTEGSPDPRLADLRALYAGAGRLAGVAAGVELLRYGDGQGDARLREALAAHLGASRAIATAPERLLVTRGSQHAFALACRLLFRDGGLLAAARLTYGSLLAAARASGGDLLRLPLDAAGLDVAALARHPRLAEVRAVYVTPHHQYPTTVTLPPERRLALLALARRWGFAVLEDDYDYDFAYDAPPRLPLAAVDDGAHVLYVGSLTEVLAPNLRVGYLHGPPDFVAEARDLRLLHDRQGDALLERGLARMIREGELERLVRRNRRVYRGRRDRAAVELRELLGGQVDFEVPSGGMALWLRFRRRPDYDLLRRRCAEQGVWVADVPAAWRRVGGMRIGFASLDDEERGRALRAFATALAAS